ncbi:DUF5714 domain-containing protein [Methanorbis rubei]|uniref:DUF5714 domain-containing protein n=1 Tax=Methanorbis rubei TaxID=3028300 RepID=A0AAE4SCQ7_9EURY|nr:hypothetical protein [Methanocorpusculaceae archaeon Cs1]
MSGGKNNPDTCILCGAPIKVVHPAQTMHCAICGRKYTDVVLCKEGHYICEHCRKDPGKEMIRSICVRSTSKNPIEIATEIMSSPVIAFRQQEHHSIVAASLLTAYKNNGGNVDDFKASLMEIIKRGTHIPYKIQLETGTSGGAMSAGIFHSVLTGMNIHNKEGWAEGAMIVAECMTKISEIEGPCCCKRCTFTAISVTAQNSEKYYNVPMDIPEKIRCKYTKRNRDCVKANCPYFPA